MGGENPEKDVKKDETKEEKPVFDGYSLIQAMTRDVAPLAQQQGGRPASLDRFLQRPPQGEQQAQNGEGQQQQRPSTGRATYGADRDAQGNPIDRTRVTPPPKFDEHHQEKKVDPDKRWADNRGGTRQGNPNAMADADKHIMDIIARRGMVNDIVRDPDARTSGGLLRGVGAIGAAAGGGAVSQRIERAISDAAERTLANAPVNKASESAVTRNASKVGEPMARFWQKYVGNGGDMVLVKEGSEEAAAATLKQEMTAAEKAAVAAAEKAGDVEATALHKARYELLNKPISEASLGEANMAKGVWTEQELKNLGRIHRAEVKVGEAASKIAAPVETNWKKGASDGVKGALGFYALNLADRSLNEAMNGKGAAAKSWNTEQWLGPASIVLFKNSKLGTAAAMAGSLGVSRAVDSLAGPAPEGWNAATGTMNWQDAGIVGASVAMASRINNPYGRLAVAALGVTTAKLLHGAEDNFVPGKIQNVYADTKEKVVDDKKERTYGSLDSMRGRYEDLANKREDYLFDLVRASGEEFATRWNMKNPDGTDVLTPDLKALSYRQDAAMRRALADETLGKGTRLIDKTKVAYVLGGYDLDLNGTAADLLMTSRQSSDRSAFTTEQIIAYNNDPANTKKILIEGSLPQQKEADDLRKFSKDTQDHLDKIFNGKHDIPGAVSDLAKFTGANSDDVLKTIIREVDNKTLAYAQKGKGALNAANAATEQGNTGAAEMATQAKEQYQQMLAKLYRDQAVAYLAMAKNKLDKGDDGGGAQGLLFNDAPRNGWDTLPGNKTKNYNGAQGAILMAAKFGGGYDNPDIKQLVDEYNKQAERVKPTIKANYANYKLNPLNVDNGLNR